MKITVLASGSDGNCYRVDDGETALLIECGLPISRIKRELNFRLNEIHACLISHEHKDHSKAAQDLARLGIDIFCSEGTAKALAIKSDHRWFRLESKKRTFIGSWDVLPFDVIHDAAEPLGFQLASRMTGETLVFITDSVYSRYRFHPMDYLMIECNYSQEILDQRMEEGSLDPALRNRVRKSHMSLEQVIELLKANDLSKLKKVFLIHLSDGNSDEGSMKRQVQEVTGVMVEVV